MANDTETKKRPVFKYCGIIIVYTKIPPQSQESSPESVYNDVSTEPSDRTVFILYFNDGLSSFWTVMNRAKTHLSSKKQQLLRKNNTFLLFPCNV
jgi:hypothetical protein